MGSALSGELSCPCDRSCFSNEHIRVQKWPRPKVLWVEAMEVHKISKNILQSHLDQMFAVGYIALPNGPLLFFSKGKSKGQKWPFPKGSLLYSTGILK